MDHSIAILFEHQAGKIRMEIPARRCIRVSKKLGASGSTSTKCVLHQVIHPLEHSSVGSSVVDQARKLIQKVGGEATKKEQTTEAF